MEDLYYIAEIISRFDVLAVQEICENLDPLDKIMMILGYDFDYIVIKIRQNSMIKFRFEFAKTNCVS